MESWKEDSLGKEKNNRTVAMEGEESGGGASSAAAVAEMSPIKRGGLYLAASLKQGWQYTVAFFTGQVKKLKARNEKEVSEADLQAAKMQVEAADEAERKKKQLATATLP